MQISLFNTNPYTEFDFPDYKKVYSVYAYDEVKAHKFFKQKKQEAINNKDPDVYNSINPYDVIKKFAIKDKTGLITHLGDEEHIYRIKALNAIYEQIGKIILKGKHFNYFTDNQFNYNGIIVYYEYYDDKTYSYQGDDGVLRVYKGQEFNHYSAVLDGTQSVSIYKRLKIHIMLLRLLRQGTETQKAVVEVKERFKEWLKK